LIDDIDGVYRTETMISPESINDRSAWCIPYLKTCNTLERGILI
jgi:hypothetical protein